MATSPTCHSMMVLGFACSQVKAQRDALLKIEAAVFSGDQQTGNLFAVSAQDHDFAGWREPNQLISRHSRSLSRARWSWHHQSALFNYWLTESEGQIGFEKEDLLGNVRANEAAFRATLEKLNDLPIVGDVRGDGYFYGIELVKDKATKETFDDDESERLLRGFMSHALFDAGLICRADDRGDPVIQLSPPLIAGPEQFEEIEAVLRPVLSEAWERIGRR